nr:MAG TPA: hypothetical protein [Caudoviricetes sp.]
MYLIWFYDTLSTQIQLGGDHSCLHQLKCGKEMMSVTFIGCRLNARRHYLTGFTHIFTPSTA